MKLLNVTPLHKAGNVRALVQIQTPSGETMQGHIVKQDGARAYLAPPEGLSLTHKDKRHLQREAVTAWANQISGTLEGLLECERVFKGSRLNRLGVQLKAFCPVCDRNTPSEFTETDTGKIRNSCFFCGTLRKGRPFISQAAFDAIREKIHTLNTKARKGTGDFNDSKNTKP